MKIFPESCDCILIVHLLMVTYLKNIFLDKFLFGIEQIRYSNNGNDFYNSIVEKKLLKHTSKLMTSLLITVCRLSLLHDEILHEPFFGISANPFSSGSPTFLLLVTCYHLHRTLWILRNLCFSDAPALSKTYFFDGRQFREE